MAEIVLTDTGFETVDTTDIEAEYYEQIKPKKLSPFDFVNAINFGNDNLFGFDSLGERQDKSDSEYPKFLINRAESYFPDTIMFANVANQYLNNIPNYSHFDFYRLAVSKKRRFSKWAKPIQSEDIDLICQHFNYSISKALEVLNLLTEQQMEEIRQIYNHGGKETKAKAK